ncbi:MBL fold metallo-hydrolase [Microbaculum marinum]|uniref:MBL fold metallo-hydrolase n=1 Tax=Microbaculum marinum TaxID=1764581 RepID=A0AAW9RUB5_9HYPH
MIAPPDTQIPGVYHRRIGDIVVTALSDGYFVTEREMTRNLPEAERNQALAAAFRDTLAFSVNAFLIYSKGRLALLETGSGKYLGPTLGHLPANLEAAGVAPDDIDTVLLTHMHPDHSAGLTDMETGRRHFGNAELVVHENEPRHWFDDEPMSRASDLYKQLHFQMTREQVQPYLDRMRTFVDGEVFPGVRAIPSAGHTPGHTSYLIESGKDRLLIWGDTIHIPEVQFARPEITMVPDTDPDAAAATRRRILEMAAQEQFLVTGMHMHFPGFGHVSKEGDAYRFHPEAWRLPF